jgi:hypothetical protein
MSRESTTRRLGHFLRRNSIFVALLGYFFVVAMPMPFYLRLVPASVIFPLLHVIPLIMIFTVARKDLVPDLSSAAWLVLLWLAIGWTAVVVLTHARTLGELNDSRSALSWWIGGGLALIWFASVSIAWWFERRRGVDSVKV